MRFVIITGLSGAGKSQAVKCMEDLGFFCVDNLPPALILKFAEICYQSGGKMDKVALVMDIRGGKLFDHLIPALNDLKETGLSYEILYLSASDDVLIKRFKESRRSHPLSQAGRLIDGIEKERYLLKEMKNIANYIIDTSELSVQHLKNKIISAFFEKDDYRTIVINVISFGFKYGIPVDSDLIFDVRFIPNPYYIESMKKLTGQDIRVMDYVLACNEANVFLQKANDLIKFLIPNYIKEGKTQLVIGIGCTGGKHRSVVIANQISKTINDAKYYCIVEHRDIEK